MFGASVSTERLPPASKAFREAWKLSWRCFAEPNLVFLDGPPRWGKLLVAAPEFYTAPPWLMVWRRLARS